METISVAFSQLVKEPTSVLDKLDHAPNGQIRLERRDGRDLLLAFNDTVTAERHTGGTATRFFVALVKTDEGARQLLHALPEVFPWVEFLTTDGVREFLVEFTDTARACASIGNYAPLDTVVAAWMHTAEIYADPELYARLTRPLDDADLDLGPVPIPETDDDDEPETR